MGEPATQGAPGEARLLARLAPDDRASRVIVFDFPGAPQPVPLLSPLGVCLCDANHLVTGLL